MNIELEEVAVLDVSDDALELAAGGAQEGPSYSTMLTCLHGTCDVLAIADR
jgi:hypothetical protein